MCKCVQYICATHMNCRRYRVHAVDAAATVLGGRVGGTEGLEFLSAMQASVTLPSSPSRSKSVEDSLSQINWTYPFLARIGRMR